MVYFVDHRCSSNSEYFTFTRVMNLLLQLDHDFGKLTVQSQLLLHVNNLKFKYDLNCDSYKIHGLEIIKNNLN